MGYKGEHIGNDAGFRVMELAGRFYQEQYGVISFQQVILLHNDPETLLYVKHHLDRVVSQAVRTRKQEYSRQYSCRDGFKRFCGTFEPLLNAMIMKQERNLFTSMTASMKKAMLSIAIERCHADRTTICNALGLSDRQLDEELRLCGLLLAVKSDKP